MTTGGKDVDCPGEGELCCFNGCAHVCSVPVMQNCFTKEVTKYQDVEKEKCENVEEDVCNMEYEKECDNVCKTEYQDKDK